MSVYRRLRVAVLLTASCLLPSCVTTQPGGNPTPTTAIADTFQELDGSLRASYARARQRAPLIVGPMATVDSRTIMLLRGAEPVWSRGADLPWSRTFADKLLDQYSALGQVPINVFLLASSQSENKATSAANYAVNVRAALEALDTSVIPPVQLPDQRLVLQSSIEMLDRLAAQTATSPADIDTFIQRVLPAYRRNFNAQAAATTAALQAAVLEMRAMLQPGEWERLYVAVSDSFPTQVARVKYEYFERLLGKGAEDRRLFLTSGQFDHRGAKYLRSVMIEDDISRAFFGQPYATRIP